MMKKLSMTAGYHRAYREAVASDLTFFDSSGRC